MGIRIRPFREGDDDQAWVDICNAAWAFDPEDVPGTVEQLRVRRDSPNYNADGRFVAELDGVPVGVVNADIDPKRREEFGWLSGPAVAPERQRQGIGTALYEKACASFRERGMTLVRTGNLPINSGGLAFLDRLGFRRIRVFTTMRRPLADLPSGVGESPDVEMQLLGRSEADAARLTRLSNQAFSEHFQHRDADPEEEQFRMARASELGYRYWTVIARYGTRDAGFLSYGYSPRENEHLGRREGRLHLLGVIRPFRGRGIAKALIIHGLHELAASGMTQVGLGVDNTNVTRALDLYRRMGFEPFREHLTFEHRLD